MEPELKALKEAVLRKAKEKAEKIIEDAEKKAEIIIGEAKKERSKRINEVKLRIMKEVERRKVEKLSEVRIKGRKNIAEAKNRVINELINEVKEKLRKVDLKTRKTSLRKLLVEITPYILESKKTFITYVCPNDRDLIQEVINELKLNKAITEVKETSNCSVILGGFILESADKAIRIDCTYKSRLDIVLRDLMPLISKKLFGEH